MKLRQVVVQVVVSVQVLAIVTIAGFIFSISPAWAGENQSNQAINQPALLIAPDPDFQINVYPKPDMDRRRIGYGSGGDTVTVIEQVGSNEGYAWNYVQFDDSPNLKGWIREDFIAMQENVGEASQNKNRAGRFSTTQNTGWDRQNTRNDQSSYYGREQRHSPQTNGYIYQGNQRQNHYNQRQN